MVQFKAGQRLKEYRMQHDLTLKDVENLSRRTAKAKRNPEYMISAARLRQVEANGSVPNLYKLASLGEIYEVSYLDILRLYGIDPEA